MVVPIAAKTGSARAKASASPPAMIDSAAFLAPSGPPETGASMKLTPLSCRSAWMRRTATGEIVLMSTIELAGRRDCQQAVLAVNGRLDMRRVGQHGDDDVGALRGLGRVLGPGRAFLDDIGDGGLVEIERAHRVPGLQQVAHHLQAHRAEADEADAALVVPSHVIRPFLG